MKIREPVNRGSLGFFLCSVWIALRIGDEGHAIWDMGSAISWLLLGMVGGWMVNQQCMLSVEFGLFTRVKGEGALRSRERATIYAFLHVFFYFFCLSWSIRSKSASQRSDASDGARSRGGGNPCLIVAVAPATSI